MNEAIPISEWVFGSGPANAKLMIVGEAPGKQEWFVKKPFVGPSGDLLTELLENAKINRQSCYITNVVKIQPPQNDLDLLCEIDNPTTGNPYKVEDFIPLLHQEIDAIKPNCILAVGSLACEVLTSRHGIKNWRGSILPGPYGIKTIPTIHPAALFERNYGKQSGEGMFSWKQKAHIQFDILKAAVELQDNSWARVPKRNIEIIKSSLQLEQFFNLYRDYKKVYVDTEVFKAHLVCIGFAFTRHHACSIPLIHLQSNENYKGIPLHDLCEIWKIVYEKLADPTIEKAGQNFKADKLYWLETSGFVVNNFGDDGMFKMHTLSPELPKSLAFQQSIFTNEPYHKHEGKEYNPYKDNIDTLLHYNGLDCVVNCECIEEMDKDIEELKLREFYKEFVMEMYPIYEGMEKRGWLLDQTKKAELSEFYKKALATEIFKETILLNKLGIEIDDKEKPYNYNSPAKVGELIYTKMRCPQRKDTADITLTALMNNAVKNPDKKAVINCKLNERSLSKLKTVYVDFDNDHDGRARCSYNQVGTETGRTSTSIIKKPLRNGQWGVPFQTIPRPDEYGGRVREMFIADPGFILVEVDQSQAEARLVALLAEDYKLLRLYDIKDVHKLTAAFCYGLTSYGGPDLIDAALNQHDGLVKINDPKWIDFSFLDNIDDFQRQIGKNSRHGLAYALGEEGLSIKMKISLYRAKIAFQKVHEMSPNIVGVFQDGIQQALGDNGRVLWTPFGRRREFFQKWGQELFREAYAHIPQSTIGDNTKRCMHYLTYKERILYHQEICKVGYAQLLAETHDAFIVQIPENKLKEYYEIVKPAFEMPINFDKCTIKRNDLVIPVDFKVGYSWGQMKKYKEWIGE